LFLCGSIFISPKRLIYLSIEVNMIPYQGKCNLSSKFVSLLIEEFAAFEGFDDSQQSTSEQTTGLRDEDERNVTRRALTALEAF